MKKRGKTFITRKALLKRIKGISELTQQDIRQKFGKNATMVHGKDFTLKQMLNTMRRNELNDLLQFIIHRKRIATAKFMAATQRW